MESPLQGLARIVNSFPGPALAVLATARAVTFGAFSPGCRAVKHARAYKFEIRKYAWTEGSPRKRQNHFGSLLFAFSAFFAVRL